MGCQVFQGQLISERKFGAFKSTKNEPKFWRISAFNSKVVQIKKIYITNAN